jgi:hypothetical protein
MKTVGLFLMANPVFAANQFQFAMGGATNYDLVVERSGNLVDWLSVMTNHGLFGFTETNAAVPQHFYRALVQP